MSKIVVDEMPNLNSDCPFYYENYYTWESQCTLQGNGYAPCHGIACKDDVCPFLVSFDTLMRNHEMEKETVEMWDKVKEESED